MSTEHIRFATLGASPTVEKPFAVLLDASDQDWADPTEVERIAKHLLDAGCSLHLTASSSEVLALEARS